MARRTTERIVRVVTEPLWRRDLLEMRTINTLVSTFGPEQRSAKRSAAKPRTAPKKKRR